MSEEKKPETGEEGKSSSKPDPNRGGASASRARNQTVMLSPEQTNQMRALLTKTEGAQIQDPLSELLPPMNWSDKPGERSGSGGRNQVVDYGSDLGGDSEAAPKRPTGKMRSPSESAGSPAGGSSGNSSGSFAAPSFSVNPSASRATTVYTPGMQMSAPAQRPPAQIAAPAFEPKAPKSKVVGFLVSFDKTPHGEVFDVRVGRWLLTSRSTEHGDNIIIEDESVSPLHAIVRATGEGKIQVLDQLSEFGTGVIRVGSETEEEVAGAMVALHHGDRVRFGKRHFVVVAIPQVTVAAESA